MPVTVGGVQGLELGDWGVGHHAAGSHAAGYRAAVSHAVVSHAVGYRAAVSRAAVSHAVGYRAAVSRAAGYHAMEWDLGTYYYSSVERTASLAQERCKRGNKRTVLLVLLSLLSPSSAFLNDIA